eukprot:TRINITY_DN3132_c0_g1_i1.p1 TRINITY_DN3132_c0_g1~~TRINITY_DN3132_c0_g1_i1.p1  ORF type:complete len:989 (+),score=264.64 TRINITY_DN3132_c0_g1_i1:226-3192(+)
MSSETAVEESVEAALAVTAGAEGGLGHTVSDGTGRETASAAGRRDSDLNATGDDFGGSRAETSPAEAAVLADLRSAQANELSAFSPPGLFVGGGARGAVLSPHRKKSLAALKRMNRAVQESRLEIARGVARSWCLTSLLDRLLVAPLGHRNDGDAEYVTKTILAATTCTLELWCMLRGGFNTPPGTDREAFNMLLGWCGGGIFLCFYLRVLCTKQFTPALVMSFLCFLLVFIIATDMGGYGGQMPVWLAVYVIICLSLMMEPARARPWFLYALAAVCISYLVLRTAEEYFDFGFFWWEDEAMQKIRDSKHLQFLAAASYTGSSVLGVFLFVRRFSQTTLAGRDSISSSIELAHRVATALRFFDLDEAESQLCRDNLNPLEESLRSLLHNLRMYRPYLPDHLVMQEGSDSEEDVSDTDAKVYEPQMQTQSERPSMHTQSEAMHTLDGFSRHLQSLQTVRSEASRAFDETRGPSQERRRSSLGLRRSCSTGSRRQSGPDSRTLRPLHSSGEVSPTTGQVCQLSQRTVTLCVFELSVDVTADADIEQTSGLLDLLCAHTYRAVKETKGVIDRFSGRVSAEWGTQRLSSAGQKRACEAAMRTIESIRDAIGSDVVPMIAIASGKALAGTVGTDTLLNQAVLGKLPYSVDVMLALRSYLSGTQPMVCGTTEASATYDFQFQTIDRIVLASGPTTMHELLARKERKEENEEWMYQIGAASVKNSYEKAVAAIFAGDRKLANQSLLEATTTQHTGRWLALLNSSDQEVKYQRQTTLPFQVFEWETASIGTDSMRKADKDEASRRCQQYRMARASPLKDGGLLCATPLRTDTSSPVRLTWTRSKEKSRTGAMPVSPLLAPMTVTPRHTAPALPLLPPQTPVVLAPLKNLSRKRGDAAKPEPKRSVPLTPASEGQSPTAPPKRADKPPAAAEDPIPLLSLRMAGEAAGGGDMLQGIPYEKSVILDSDGKQAANPPRSSPKAADRKRPRMRLQVLERE